MTSLDFYREMTKEQFMGRYVIQSNRVAAKLPIGIESAPLEPFMEGKYQARFHKRSVVVYNGSLLPIAIYYVNENGTTMKVKAEYRRQGIAAEMLYFSLMKQPRALNTAPQRTPEVQAMVEKVWLRIQKELGNG